MNKKLENYISDHTSEADMVLNELFRETHTKVLMPRMLSGHVQGKLLQFLSEMIKPQYILEIGTFTGYATICLSKGLVSNGKIITIEINDELEYMAAKYFIKAGIEPKTEQIIGDALHIIPKLNFMFDLIFIDGDKREYPQYFNLVLDKLKPGGFIIADNVLWNQKVLAPVEDNDLYTKGVVAFNTMVKNNPNVECVMLPLRDGLTLIKKN